MLRADVAYAMAVDAAGASWSPEAATIASRHPAYGIGLARPGIRDGWQAGHHRRPAPGVPRPSQCVLVDGAGSDLLGGSSSNSYVIRLASNGTRDASFGTGGVVALSGMSVNAMDLDASGQFSRRGRKPMAQTTTTWLWRGSKPTARWMRPSESAASPRTDRVRRIRGERARA